MEEVKKTIEENEVLERPLQKSDFEFLGQTFTDAEVARPSLTYWQDAWRRLRKHKLAMVGIIVIIICILFAFIGPMFMEMSYSDQKVDFKNIGLKMKVWQIADDEYIFKTEDYNLILVNGKGEILKKLPELRHKRDLVNRVYYYQYSEEETIKLDFSYNVLPAKKGKYDYDYSITFRGEEHTYYDKTLRNKSFPLGTDSLGRNMLSRLMFGTKISLVIAFIATIVNLFIGVIYGAISGYEGGAVDIIMMRIVDIINSIPLTLYVILLMVWIPKQEGLLNIIIALSTVYWVGTARLVRGQLLSIKEQEFILAARTIGVPKHKIILKHLIPNAIGPIIVSMAMMIPSAIFTEAFLSFIGIGVSAPMASLGTLANDALPALTTYPYQLIEPAIAIAIIILAFNFLGDGLRDALDPRLRKG